MHRERCRASCRGSRRRFVRNGECLSVLLGGAYLNFSLLNVER